MSQHDHEDLGKLLTAQQVIDRYFPSVDGERTVTVRWVYENVFPRVDLARGQVRYYERHVKQKGRADVATALHKSLTPKRGGRKG